MRITSRLSGAVLAATVLSLTAAGCGSSTPVTPALNVALTVPVNGATVMVSSVHVVGDVSANEVGAPVALRVSGHRTRVQRGGAFDARVRLHRGLNRIRVVADAPGYPRTVSMLRVRFRPGPPPPPQSLAEEVNAICMKYDSQSFGLYVGNASPNLGDVQREVRYISAGISRMRTITAPPPKASAYAAFVDSLQGADTNLEAIIVATRTKSLPALRQAVTGANADMREMVRLGRPLGFAQCLFGGV